MIKQEKQQREGTKSGKEGVKFTKLQVRQGDL